VNWLKLLVMGFQVAYGHEDEIEVQKKRPLNEAARPPFDNWASADCDATWFCGGDAAGSPRWRAASNSRRLILATLKINGEDRTYEAPDYTPLLWVIREELKLTGTKFGCGVGLCGACVVHIDGKRAFSCQMQVSNVAGKEVTTIEGLSPDSSHPVQKAWLAERVPQCGYCQSGQIMSAADLLKRNPHPTRAEILAQMSGHICRCGTYLRIVRAIERAAREG
jgi:isoquinoline 1-oxidoreductase subunit alpha